MEYFISEEVFLLGEYQTQIYKILSYKIVSAKWARVATSYCSPWCFILVGILLGLRLHLLHLTLAQQKPVTSYGSG